MECTDEIVRMVLVDRDGCGISEWCKQCSDCLDCSKAVSKYMFGRIDELESREAVDVSDYMELPKDADGEHIHLVDEVREDESGHVFVVEGFEMCYGEWWVFKRDGARAPVSDCHHYHKPTVESVLHDFAQGIADVLGGDDFLLDDNDEMYEDFAAKIREAMSDGR